MKWDRDDKQLFKIDLNGGISEQLTRRGDNFDADWFDPAFALPVSPQPHFLTTMWGKSKYETNVEKEISSYSLCYNERSFQCDSLAF